MRVAAVLRAIALSVCCVAFAAGQSKTPAAPDNKQILKYLFGNLDVPLSAGKDCRNVGTSPGDRTIGDFLSGFWSEHANQQGSNWLKISAEPDEGGASWICTVMLHRKDGEEVWGWGVRFRVGMQAKRVIRTSFQCLGAG